MDLQDKYSAFEAEHSFTILNFMIFSKLQNFMDFKLERTDPQYHLQLGFCIFPSCETFLHKVVRLSKKAEGKEKEMSDKIERSDITDLVSLIFDKASKGISYVDESQIYDVDEKLEIPILPDAEDNTPLDIALGSELKLSNKLFVLECVMSHIDEFL